MPFLDFEKIKSEHAIEDIAAKLKLVLKPGNGQLRGPCPFCSKGGDRALAITPSKGVFFCFGANKGGDVLALVAHINNVAVKDAAEWIVGKVPDPSPHRSPESDGGKQGERTLQPLSYLEADHPAVVAVGFDLEVAKALGVGYSPKGIMRGLVAVPIRDENGALLGYIGITEAKLPTNFMSNIVPFGKKSA